MLNWERQPSVKKFKISKKSVAVLQCLSKDMEYIFRKVYFEYDRVAKEDKNSKYECVRELLEIKYSELPENLRYKIYEQFVSSYEIYRQYN